MGIDKSFQFIRDTFVRFLGDVKIFKFPFFFLYDPGSYLVKGNDMREVINIAKPGDILVRGYKNYLDGYLIPGYFSHVGLYLGKVADDDREFVPKESHEYFRSGDQMVIHSMAEGVFMEDLLGFCFCDYMAILRFPNLFGRDQDTAIPEFVLTGFTDVEKDYIQDLTDGNELEFEKIWPLIFRLALSRLGTPYDFGFNFANFNNLSCSEFVYFCTKSVWWCLGTGPLRKRFLMLAKEIIQPDAFVASKLQLMWHSRSTKQEHLEKLRAVFTQPKHPEVPHAVSG